MEAISQIKYLSPFNIELEGKKYLCNDGFEDQVGLVAGVADARHNLGEGGEEVVGRHLALHRDVHRLGGEHSLNLRKSISEA